MGHEVTEAAPAIDVEALTDAFVTLAVSGGALDVEMAARLTGSKPKAANFELHNRGLSHPRGNDVQTQSAARRSKVVR